MTKLEIKDASPNYAATVVRIPQPVKHPNADRLELFNLFGYTVIAGLGDFEPGSLAVFFPAEAQLSEKLTREAGLYRHQELNADNEKKGYLEDNRRVRALRLRGTISSGLLLPCTVVNDIYGIPLDVLAEGASFDHIDGQEVCRKYRVKEPAPRNAREKAALKKAFKRVDETMLPEHIDTEMYLRNEAIIDDDEILIVSQKLHGTSIRLAQTIVKNKLTWLERLAKRVGVRVQETTYDYIAGSRKVIKDPKSTTQNHFYAADIWSRKLREVQDAIPQGFIIYGEVVGWTEDGGAIQKGHTYRLPQGENELYVYRVSQINPQGRLYDLSWDQVRAFCQERGLKYTPELWRGFKRDFDLSYFEERDFYSDARNYIDTGRDYLDVPVPLSPDGTGADEGIVIRVERGAAVPLLLKYKNQSHFLYETNALDEGVEDLESAA